MTVLAQACGAYFFAAQWCHMSKSVERARLSKEERTYGREMQRLRKEKGLSQSEMADVLRAVGIEPMNQVIVSRIENGVRPVTMREAQFISAYFNRTTWSMMSPEGANSLAGEAAARATMSEASRLAVQNAVGRFLIDQAEVAALLERIRAVDWEQEHPDSRLDIATQVPRLDEFLKLDVRDVVETAIGRSREQRSTAS
ncbi:helix-turn-helix domain-containing protein [Curtobacterium flaccumfaciens pv. flaccumfaciens]|uniref:helix-turn-helix domain-containing protein n=1 Tax=Curtobacterium poinsettiae TaxID=159612 RepID=UPI00217E8420|nr:helix-turn-helix transcriptional regulator [Curtobacterium flaccumfaciens]MCS6565560.1 helix-turn-helix domain-containing protein [Curtobacterium flaccumfaciens pv. flaccumfaciens]